MANSVTMTLGFSNTEFTRKLKLENVADEAISGVKSKILAVNASLSGGNDGGLKEFFISDDYDATDSNNVVGQLTGITAAQIDETEVTLLNVAE